MEMLPDTCKCTVPYCSPCHLDSTFRPGSVHSGKNVVLLQKGHRVPTCTGIDGEKPSFRRHLTGLSPDRTRPAAASGKRLGAADARNLSLSLKKKSHCVVITAMSPLSPQPHSYVVTQGQHVSQNQTRPLRLGALCSLRARTRITVNNRKRPRFSVEFFRPRCRIRPRPHDKHQQTTAHA